MLHSLLFASAHVHVKHGKLKLLCRSESLLDTEENCNVDHDFEEVIERENVNKIVQTSKEVQEIVSNDTKRQIKNDFCETVIASIVLDASGNYVQA